MRYWGLTCLPSCCHPSLAFPYCFSGWAGPGEVGEVLEAHLAPTSSWHIPPAQETQPGASSQPLSHPQAHRGAGGLQTSLQVPASSAGSLCACSQGKQSPAPAKAVRELPLRKLEEANSPRVNAKPSRCLIIFWSSSRDAWAGRAMGSLWSPFPAFYSSGKGGS